jgi:hypothetical protein
MTVSTWCQLVIQYIFPNQLGKILLFVTSYEKCDVSKRQLILKSVTLYVKIRKTNLISYFHIVGKYRASNNYW